MDSGCGILDAATDSCTCSSGSSPKGRPLQFGTLVNAARSSCCSPFQICCYDCWSTVGWVARHQRLVLLEEFGVPDLLRALAIRSNARARYRELWLTWGDTIAKASCAIPFFCCIKLYHGERCQILDLPHQKCPIDEGLGCSAALKCPCG